MRQIFRVIREAFEVWRRHDVRELGAAIAFYAGFSLVPMLLTMAVIAGAIFSPEQVENQIVRSIRDLVGQNASDAIREALNNINGTEGFSVTITLFNVVVMLVGATNLFRHLKGALNAIWEAEKPQTNTLTEEVKEEVKSFVKTTLVSLLMVAVVGIALLFWVVGSTALFYYFRSLDMGLWKVAGYGFLFIVMTVTFAVAYKTMPDPDLKWRDVSFGAVLTALLFLFGQALIIMLIGQSNLDTVYGTASMLTFILVWVYVSAQMVVFGAVLTKVYARICDERDEACLPEVARNHPEPRRRKERREIG